MLDLYLPILGVLFGAGLALATALVLGARYGLLNGAGIDRFMLTLPSLFPYSRSGFPSPL